MRRITFILLLICSFFTMQASAASAAEYKADAALTEGKQVLDMKEFLFGHIGDSYEWHITTVNGHHISIHLPVILYSRTSGWHFFNSNHIAESGTYEGFRVAGTGEKHEGKLVEITETGPVRPIDLSITKNVAAIIFSSALLVILVLCTAKWYRRHDASEESPRGFTGVMEMVITMIEDDIIKDCIGKDYKRYSPYLLTAFFFIFLNNLLGIMPFFPGGANITGNIAVTLVLALFTFFMVNVFGNKHYWKDILWPDVPIFLKAIPIMPAIEIIGMFTKPFSLMIRLFANILAGHIMLLGVIAMIFLTAKLGPAINSSLSAVTVLFGIFMDILEFLVAFLQAYVFTMLSAVFIGLSRQEPETEKQL